jgi:hypothetical protein
VQFYYYGFFVPQLLLREKHNCLLAKGGGPGLQRI